MGYFDSGCRGICFLSPFVRTDCLGRRFCSNVMARLKLGLRAASGSWCRERSSHSVPSAWVISKGVPGFWLSSSRHGVRSRIEFVQMRCPLLRQVSC